jgi:hypothetical protein
MKSFRKTITKAVRVFRQKHAQPILTKRQECVLVSAMLSIGLLLTQLIPDYRYPMTIVLSLLTYLASAFVLRTGLSGIEWVSVLSLPALFTASVTLFYFLLPLRWITRIPVVTLYAIGMYALLLTENIYNVATNRTIALLRAAHTVGFLITLVAYFLLLSTVFSFRMHAIPTIVVLFGINALLIFQILWAMELGEKASRRLLRLTLAISFIFTEIAWIISFWPVKTTMKALLLTTYFYSIVGLAQQYLSERMYKKTVVEFGIVAVVVTIVVIFVTNWRGMF